MKKDNPLLEKAMSCGKNKKNSIRPTPMVMEVVDAWLSGKIGNKQLAIAFGCQPTQAVLLVARLLREERCHALQ